MQVAGFWVDRFRDEVLTVVARLITHVCGLRRQQTDEFFNEGWLRHNLWSRILIR